jgi:hypothetical protein
MKQIITALVVLMALSISSAQQNQPAPCSAAEYKQFDFWVGEWNVFEFKNGQPGAPQGASRINRIFGGCAIQEEFLDASGRVIGRSLNAYWAQDRLWHQMYVDGLGQVIRLSGKLENGVMMLSGEYPSQRTAGLIIKQRIGWSIVENDPNRVRQHWQVSPDGRQTWQDIFDGLYVRKR